MPEHTGTTGGDRVAATCERCGAPLTLAEGDSARCLFCLHRQPLPTEVATPLVEHAELSRDLAILETRVSKLAGADRYFWIIVAAQAPLLLMVGAGLARATASNADDPLAAMMFGAIGGLGMLPFLAVPVLWARVQRDARTRVLAALPPATPRVVGSEVHSSCPNCGAEHPAGRDALTVICAHCRTESLLPLPAVSERLTQKHGAVADARARGDAEIDARKAAVAAWQRMVKPAILGFGAFFFAVMVMFIIAAEMRTP